MSSDDEDERKLTSSHIPKTIITKIVKDTLPSNVLVRKEVYDVLQACTGEFIRLLSSEAAQIVERKEKSLIKGTDVLEAVLVSLRLFFCFFKILFLSYVRLIKNNCIYKFLQKIYKYT